MTPEEIAREAAGQMLCFDNVQPASLDGNEWSQIVLGGVHVGSQWMARAERLSIRDAVAAAAVQRALACAPVPSPVGEERLAGIRATLRQADEHGYALHRDHVRELLAHVEHLTRALHDCGQDGTASIWSSGYEAGKAAGRAEGVEAERKRCARLAAELELQYPTTCRGGDTIARAIEEG